MGLLTPILLIHVGYKTRMHTERGDQSQDTKHRMPNKSTRKIIKKNNNDHHKRPNQGDTNPEGQRRYQMAGLPRCIRCLIAYRLSLTDPLEIKHRLRTGVKISSSAL